MSDASSSPIHVAQPINAPGDILITPVIYDYEGSAEVRLSNGEGLEVIIPADLLPALASRAGLAHSTISNLVDEQRRLFLGDLSEFGLVKRRTDGQLWSLPDAEDTKADGTPVIRWVRPKDGKADNSGWALYLAGADDATISMARWNDRDALAALVESMHDRELLITMAGMTHSEVIANLSARMSASNLRANRALPAIDTKRVREVLVAAALGTEGIAAANGGRPNRYSAPQTRALHIQSLGRKVPVAVAIASPSLQIRDLTEQEKQLGWKERHALETDLREQAVAPWLAKAKETMTAAGWRIIDLPVARRSYYAQTSMFWVTRIDPETWTSVAAAATAAAKEFSFSRATAF